MKLPSPKSKYRNIKTNSFASKKEAKRYQELKLLEKAGQIGEIFCQFPFTLAVNGQVICRYVADFVYSDDSGRVVEDVKGVRTPIYRLKAKLMKAIYGIQILET